MIVSTSGGGGSGNSHVELACMFVPKTRERGVFLAAQQVTRVAAIGEYISLCLLKGLCF